MKKRKELDALVSNGKAGKRLKKTSGSCSAHELLKHQTESSDLEDFAVINPRKCRKKSSSHLPLTSICLPLCQFVLVLTGILISGTLIWLHIGLREDLDILRAHIQKVEAGNKNTPEALHIFHNDLKKVGDNVSSLFLEIKRNAEEIENATAEIKKLKIATARLQESIDAAPTLKQLPKNVESLSESVVTFGSKISALETSMKELKDSQSTIQSTTQTLTGEFDSIKTSVQVLNESISSSVEGKFQSLHERDSNLRNALDNTKEQVTSIRDKLDGHAKHVNTVDSTLVNHRDTLFDLLANVQTLNDAVLSTLGDNRNQTARLDAIEDYTYANLTVGLEHLENKCFGNIENSCQNLNVSEIQSLLNRTVTDAIVNLLRYNISSGELRVNLNNSKKIIPLAHNMLLLLAGLLKQFSHIPAEAVLTENDTFEIIDQLCKSTLSKSVKIEPKQSPAVNTLISYTSTPPVEGYDSTHTESEEVESSSSAASASSENGTVV